MDISTRGTHYRADKRVVSSGACTAYASLAVPPVILPFMQQNVGVFLESAESECPKRTVPSWLEWILSGDSEVTTRDSETMYRLSPAAWGCADGKACAWRRAIAAHNSELTRKSTPAQPVLGWESIRIVWRKVVRDYIFCYDPHHTHSASGPGSGSAVVGGLLQQVRTVRANSIHSPIMY